MFRSPVLEASIFFSGPVAGLTNRVQDSRAGAPLLGILQYTVLNENHKSLSALGSRKWQQGWGKS